MKAEIPIPHDYIEFFRMSFENRRFGRQELEIFLEELKTKIDGVLENRLNEGISFVNCHIAFFSSEDYNNVLGHVSGSAYLEIMGKNEFRESFNEQYSQCCCMIKGKFEKERWEERNIDAEIHISGARECGIEEIDAFYPGEVK